jgi:hypothetical protein
LYLIGLSFNRFLFNIDKIFINLCIISNFLFFLSNYNPKILLVGNSKYSSFFKFFSYETNNLYYEYKLLPGSIIGTIEASNFASRNQFDIFNNNFDCIIQNSGMDLDKKHGSVLRFLSDKGIMEL